jgi:hypothetical protein
MTDSSLTADVLDVPGARLYYERRGFLAFPEQFGGVLDQVLTAAA